MVEEAEADASGEGVRSLDWPLSREEKKTCLMRLYDSDLQTANNLVRSGEEALEALRSELSNIKHSQEKKTRKPARQASPKPSADGAATEKDAPETPEAEAGPREACGTPPPEREQSKARSPSPHVAAATAEQAERLHRVIMEATAALRGLLGVPQSDDEGSEIQNSEAEPVARRSKSEPSREVKAMPGALRRDARRHSRDGKPLRVSFSRDESLSDLCSDTESCKVDSIPNGDSAGILTEPEPDPGDTQANTTTADVKPETDGTSGTQTLADSHAQIKSLSGAAGKKKSSRNRRHQTSRDPVPKAETRGGTNLADRRGRGRGVALDSKQRGVPILVPRELSAEAALPPHRDEQAAPPPASSIDFL
mmetsp:Transcript_11915/g.21807  ORF Transcript_11915/g.21807 Transcript_11915/m.21807 type:complete len:366 (+) Transcript_11915:33-1130(+)